jgi:restriction system protein
LYTRFLMPIPTYDGLFNPLLKAAHELGGSASVAEQEDKVTELLKLSNEEAAEIHRGNRTKLSYRLAWARNYLKRYGLLENSARGVWALTATGQTTKHVDPKEVNRVVKDLDRLDQRESQDDEVGEEVVPAEDRWQETALNAIKSISPKAFEILCQRLLRESGFIQVEVTGRGGDGGIDGMGVVKVGGILSFHVIFQCKRYKDAVSAALVRDFRGAMVGRADKGLLITTGNFTRDARLEAQRDGAPPLDLIDGNELVEKLKELRLGIHVREKTVEKSKWTTVGSPHYDPHKSRFNASPGPKNSAGRRRPLLHLAANLINSTPQPCCLEAG